MQRIRNLTPASFRNRARVAAQRAYLKLQPWLESIGEIHAGDPAASRFAAFGRGSRIGYPQVALVNPGGVAIGTDTYIRSYFNLEAYAPPGSAVVRIGNGVQLGHYVRVVAFNGIEMEDLVGIGHWCSISDSVHDWKAALEEDGKALWDTPAKLGRVLRIGKGAFLGNNCVIVGGITIGEWSIVDHNSVVNRDVPPYSIVGGNPARVLRVRRADGTWEILDDPPLLANYTPDLSPP